MTYFLVVQKKQELFQNLLWVQQEGANLFCEYNPNFDSPT